MTSPSIRFPEPAGATPDRSTPDLPPRHARGNGHDLSLCEWLAGALLRLAEVEHKMRPRVLETIPRRRVGGLELVDMINRELAARPECASIAVGPGPGALGPGHGTDWLGSWLTVRVSGYAGPGTLRALREVVDDAAAHYEVVSAAA